ncbi:MAG: glycosyltransferase family 87 protein [Gemmataceae bacterium]
MTRYLSLPVLYGLFAVAALTLAAFPVVNHFRQPVGPTPTYELWASGAHTLNKDYPLWYATGRRVVDGLPLYPTQPGVAFPFMYPPFAGVCLAGLSLLGPTGMVIALAAGNVLSWWAAIELSLRLVAGTGRVNPWVRVVPGVISLFFVYDMFLLGQPNLFLLAVVLAGFLCLRHRHEWAAGGLFALATAIKAFPAVIVVYLLWRRYWAAAAGMVLGTAALLVLAPAPVRGFDRNLAELKTWANGMLLKNDDRGFGQRPEQSQGWRNQSVLGVVTRLVRPVDAEADAFDPAVRGLYVNVLALDERTARLAVAGVCGLLGLGFVAAMPRRADRTRESDAAEFAVLTILVVVGTPYAFGYYFVWLLYPATVLTWHAVEGDRRGRWVSWAALAVGSALLVVGSPVGGRTGAAVGGLLWGSLVFAAALGWHLWRTPAGQANRSA